MLRRSLIVRQILDITFSRPLRGRLFNGKFSSLHMCLIKLIRNASSRSVYRNSNHLTATVTHTSQLLLCNAQPSNETAKTRKQLQIQFYFCKCAYQSVRSFYNGNNEPISPDWNWISIGVTRLSSMQVCNIDTLTCAILLGR